MTSLWARHPDSKDIITELAELIIKAERPKKVRGKQYNRYYWAVVVKTMEGETGYTAKECHDLLKKLLLPAREVELNGIRVQLLANTHDMEPKDFDNYVERCRTWIINQFGVAVPLPNEVPAGAY